MSPNGATAGAKGIKGVPQRFPLGNAAPVRGAPTDYHALFDALDQGVCLIEVQFDAQDTPVDYRFLEVNPAFAAQTGLENAVGKRMRELRSDHEQHWFDIYGEVALTGQAARFEKPAAALGRWYDVYAFRVGPAHQRRVAIVFSDITKRKRNDEQLALLATEMGHRAQNMLAIITSIVHLTQADSVAELKSALMGRIEALRRAQDVLSENRGVPTSLGSVVENAVEAYRGDRHDRVTWNGPHVALSADTAKSLTMALHELATNATKYGAFSSGAGNVRIEWTRIAEDRICLRWSETGGPPVLPPAKRGLGMGVILSSVHDPIRGGAVHFDWRRDGLVCELVLRAEGLEH